MNDIIISDLLINNINRIYQREYDKSDIFCKRYYVYRYWITMFIINKYKIKNYDMELEKSNLNYLPTDKSNMDFYQDFSKDYLKYFYVRNEIYLNNLSADEIVFLDKYIDKYDIKNDLIVNYIEKTYKKVITKKIGSDVKYKVFFGPDSRNFTANDGDIVIGVRYDEFNLNGYSDSEWNDIHDKQLDYLNKVIGEIQNLYPNETKVIKYNQYSIF